MTLVSKLRQKLSDDGPCPERHDLQVTDEESGSAATLAIQQRDGLSSLVWELSARRTAPASQVLRQWAERLAGRVTSLLEPLALLEIDSLRNQAMLRSARAAEEKDSATYFEVILDGVTSAQVRRYKAAKVADEAGQLPRREQIAFALTHEGLAKLVADLTAP
jgi:hypothetical protein